MEYEIERGFLSFNHSAVRPNIDGAWAAAVSDSKDIAEPAIWTFGSV